MARTAKPWFYRQTGWQMVWLNGTKHKLANGKANRREADIHAHHCDYFYVVIGNGELNALNPDGSVLHCGPMRDGEVHYRAIDSEPAVHEAINAGKQEWRNIIVELKEKALR